MLASLPPAGFAGAEPGYLSRHRRPRPRRPLAPDLRRADRADRRLRRREPRRRSSAPRSACSPAGSAAGSTRVISRLVDVWMAFPPVLLSILLVAVLGAGLGLGDRRDRRHRLDALLPRRARRDHGAGAERTMSPRRAPSASPPRAYPVPRDPAQRRCRCCMALLSLEMGIAVIVEAILSFVGLSVSSDTPTWGGMIAEGRQIIHQAWWMLAAPLRRCSRPCSPSTCSATACARSARSGAAPMTRAAPRHRRLSARSRDPRRRRGRSCAASASISSARRGAWRSSARAAPASRPSPRRCSGCCRARCGSPAATIQLRRPRSRSRCRRSALRAVLGRDIALIPQDPMTALNPVAPHRARN